MLSVTRELRPLLPRGIFKFGKLLGIVTGTVQRISNELWFGCTRGTWSLTLTHLTASNEQTAMFAASVVNCPKH